MKVALVLILLMAAVLISRSAGNPAGRKGKQFGGQSYNGPVETVHNCATTGSCQHGGQKYNQTYNQEYNGPIDQVHNCAATGSCHNQGKKKRSVVPQVLRQPKQFEGQTYNGPVGEINNPNPGPGFEGQTFNGPVGNQNNVSGADQPSGDDFQFPKSLNCTCPDQSRPGSWICIKDEPQCQCQCKPFAVYEPSVMTNMISSSPRQNRQFGGQTFNGAIGEINNSGADHAVSQAATGIASTNPNPNPCTSGISPQEFVNELGIRYKGNYFNMHLNTL